MTKTVQKITITTWRCDRCKDEVEKKKKFPDGDFFPDGGRKWYIIDGTKSLYPNREMKMILGLAAESSIELIKLICVGNALKNW